MNRPLLARPSGRSEQETQPTSCRRLLSAAWTPAALCRHDKRISSCRDCTLHVQSAHLTLPAGLEQIAPIANQLAVPTSESVGRVEPRCSSTVFGIYKAQNSRRVHPGGRSSRRVQPRSDRKALSGVSDWVDSTRDSTQSLVPGLYWKTSPWYNLNCTKGLGGIHPVPES